MPRAETKLDRSDAYTEMRRASVLRNERWDCTVVAVAAVTGATYKEAHAAMKAAGRKDRQGATILQQHEALRMLGFKATRVKSSFFIQQYGKSHQVLKSVTTHHPERFNKVWKDGRNYMLHSNAHVSACINGTLMDWAQGRALRAHLIYRIEKED